MRAGLAGTKKCKKKQKKHLPGRLVLGTKHCKKDFREKKFRGAQQQTEKCGSAAGRLLWRFR